MNSLPPAPETAKSTARSDVSDKKAEGLAPTRVARPVAPTQSDRTNGSGSSSVDARGQRD